MRIAFVNMGTYRDAISGKQRLVEPVHLLGMHNIVEDQGHRSMIFQYGLPSPGGSVRQVKKFKPDVLALSFIGQSEEGTQGAHKILQSLGRNKPKLVIGGPDLRYNYQHYLDEFSPYYPQNSSTSGNFVMVRGEGERFMLSWVTNGLSIDATMKELHLSGLASKRAFVFLDPPHLPLNEQGFERPYKDLSYYGDVAYVKWGSGCWGKCLFCSLPSSELDYRDPSSVLEELSHLRSLGARRIAIASPNFLAHLPKAAAIMKVLPKQEFEYEIVSRVDSLFFAIRNNPDLWGDFSAGQNSINLGAESLIPERLGPERLGKYPSLKQAEKQEERLEFLLDFFQGSNTVITLNIILFDWQMTLTELEREVRQMINYLENYQPNLGYADTGMNRLLHYDAGSALSEKMKQLDFYNFERDPRALLLYALSSVKLREVMKNFPILTQMYLAFFRTSTDLPLSLLRALHSCVQKTAEIPVEHFQIEPILDIVRGTQSDDDILEGFYAQLCGEEVQYFRNFFDRRFQAVRQISHHML